MLDFIIRTFFTKRTGTKRSYTIKGENRDLSKQVIIKKRQLQNEVDECNNVKVFSKYFADLKGLRKDRQKIAFISRRNLQSTLKSAYSYRK